MKTNKIAWAITFYTFFLMFEASLTALLIYYVVTYAINRKDYRKKAERILPKFVHILKVSCNFNAVSAVVLLILSFVFGMPSGILNCKFIISVNLIVIIVSIAVSVPMALMRRKGVSKGSLSNDRS